MTGELARFVSGDLPREVKTTADTTYFCDVTQSQTTGTSGKLGIEKDAPDFISEMSMLPPVGKPKSHYLMIVLRILALSTTCLVLASCKSTKSGSSDPYASNYGNDGHYNPYPGQSGYASPSAPTYQKPPAPAKPEPPADPYAFSATKKTPPSKSPSSSTTTSTPKESTVASSSTAKKKSAPSKSTAKKSSSGSRHTVTKGDTLYGIALKKKTTVAKIKAANGLNNDLIRPGQSLKIP